MTKATKKNTHVVLNGPNTFEGCTKCYTCWHKTSAISSLHPDILALVLVFKVPYNLNRRLLIVKIFYSCFM